MTTARSVMAEKTPAGATASAAPTRGRPATRRRDRAHHCADDEHARQAGNFDPAAGSNNRATDDERCRHDKKNREIARPLRNILICALCVLCGFSVLAESDSCQHDDGQARKQQPLRFRPRLRSFPPQAQVRVGREVRVDVGGEVARFGQRPRVEPELPQLGVRQEERRSRREHDGDRRADARQRPRITPEPTPRQLPRRRASRRGEGQRNSAARQVSARATRRARRRAAAAAASKPVQTEQRERHPRGRQHLKGGAAMRYWRERERGAGDEAGGGAAGQPAEQELPSPSAKVEGRAGCSRGSALRRRVDRRRLKTLRRVLG